MAGSSDWCTGVTMADVNGDGLLDIYVCAVQGEHGLKGRNELFINNGNGTLQKVQKNTALPSRPIPPRLFFLIMIMMATWIVLF